MEQQRIEVVGKVFEVVGDKRRCLICEGTFAPKQAAAHATTVCHPNSRDAGQHERTSDPRFC
jgi:nitrate reductase cytochrome c-type subunit